MPTRSEIRDFARQQTLVSTGEFSNDKANNVINEGVREVTRRFKWPFLATSDQITFFANDRSKALPDDLEHIEAIVVEGGKKLRETSPSDAWEAYGDEFKSGTPTEYFLWADRIYLVPYPQSETTLEVFYYNNLSSLDNDTDEPAWSSRFHMVLADYLVWRLWEREEEEAKAAHARQNFGAGVEAMARHYLNQAKDQPIIFGESARPRRRNARSFIAGIDG